MKKINVYIFALLSSAMFLNACQSPKSELEIAKKQKEQSPTVEVVKVNDELLDAIFVQYIQLKEALINENTINTIEAATRLEVGANHLHGGEKLTQFATKIALSKEIDYQRNVFSLLSDEMIVLIKAKGLKSGKIFIDHCPMVNNDKGANWLSNYKEIRNPYYGEMMMDCGAVKEAIVKL